MEKDERIEVWVVGCKVLCFVERVEVFDVGGDFHCATQTCFNDGAEGVPWRSFGEREFVVSVCHGFWSDEHEVEGRAWE
jgi:hypothetical protein